MKTFFFFLLTFSFVLQIMAQDPGYDGPAKAPVAAFYKQAEDVRKAIENGKKYGQFNAAEGKVNAMEANLKKAKEKDPGYSQLSQMEATLNSLKKEVETYKAAAANKIASGRQEASDKTKSESLLQTVIDGTQMEVGSNNLPYMDKAMADFKANADQVLKLDLLKYKVKLDELKIYVDRSHTLAADRLIAKAKTVLAEVRNAENFDPIYKELQFRQLYWDVIRKIYAGDATCEKYYKSVSDMLAKTGSPEDVKKTAAQNNATAIKDKRMPAAVVKDAVLEKALLDGFNSKYKETFKGTAIKAVILQADWYIERNDITGIVTGRNRPGALVYKGADGKCYLLNGSVYVYQPYVGGSFGKTEVIYRGFGSEEMLCGNVK